MNKNELKFQKHLNDIYGTVNDPFLNTEELYGSSMVRWDFENNHTIVEFKNRFQHHDAMQIDKSKYDALMAQADSSGKIPLYVNKTPNGLFVWNLHAIAEPKWVPLTRRKTTDFADQTMVTKLSGFLPIDVAFEMQSYA